MVAFCSNGLPGGGLIAAAENFCTRPLSVNAWTSWIGVEGGALVTQVVTDKPSAGV